MMYLSQITMLYTLNLHSAVCPEKAMAPHSSTLAWKIPWTEEPGRLQSMGSRGVRHDWATSLFTFMHWGRKWQPTPVFLPEESQGWRSLVGCRLWGCTESDTTSGLNCFSYDMDSTLLTCRTFQMDSNLLYLLTWHINSLACCSPWDHSQTQLSYWTTTKDTFLKFHKTEKFHPSPVGL